MGQIYRFSSLASKMQPSPIRELFKITQQPGMISFAGGLPDPAAFPIETFASCADVLAENGREVLQYSASEGYGPLRAALTELMTRHLGREVPPDALLITSGSQQAMDLIARALLDPGDVVVLEAPTYPGTIHCLRNAGARFACIPCDGDGMLVDHLAATVAKCEAETGRRPKLIYTVPDFSNPTGACMSLARRRRLVELAAELEIPVFEDDPYGRVRYAGEPLPNLARLTGAERTVIYASSFSKILAPGVRVAWTVAAPELIRALVLMRQGEDLCTSTVTQALVAEYTRRGLLDSHLGHIIETYAEKAAAMQHGLEEHLPAGRATWHTPDGGFFYWLRFPGIKTRRLFDRAIEEKVAFVPGPAFVPGSGEQVTDAVDTTEYARLCFTFADPQEIDEGCRRLARACETS